MLKSIIVITLAVFLSFFLVKHVFKDPRFSNADDKISYGDKMQKPYLAWEGYMQVVHKDTFNVWNHYYMLEENYDMLQSNAISESQQSDIDLTILSFYRSFCKSASPKLNDIGNFGLGIYAYFRNNDDEAKGYFDKINDALMPMVNYARAEMAMRYKEPERPQLDITTINENNAASLARTYDSINKAVALRENPKIIAERYYKKEIAINGNVYGAVHALAMMYYHDKRDKDIIELASSHDLSSYLPTNILRKYYYQNGIILPYLALVYKSMYRGASALMILAALFIALIWLNYLRRIDIFKPEKWYHLAIVFLMGMMSTVFVYPLEDGERLLFGIGFDAELTDKLFYSIGFIGVVEELVKIIPLLVLLSFRKILKGPIDYIIFASVSALGFSFAENIVYFHSASLFVILLRGLLSTTIYMAMTSLVAYGFIMQRYRKDKMYIPPILSAFVLAASIHGFLDYGLTSSLATFSLLYIGMPCVLIWSIVINTGLNLSNMATDQSEIDAKKTSAYLHYAFASVFIIFFLAEGYLYGPTVTLKNTPPFTVLAIPFLVIIAARLSYFDIVPGYWLPVAVRGKVLISGWYEIDGRQLIIKSFRPDSILEDMPNITGHVLHDMDVDDNRWYLIELNQPLDMGGSTYSQAIIGAENNTEPAGLMPNVICYFMLVPNDVNADANIEFSKKDFEFIDWALVSPVKTKPV